MTSFWVRQPCPVTRVPRELRQRPFTLEEARGLGVSRRRLSGRSWRHLASELYCWRGWREDPFQLLSAWYRLLPKDAVFAGATAAWLWSIGTNPLNPIEIIVQTQSGVRSRRGLVVRRCELTPDDVTEVRGLPATSLHRTLRDHSVRLSPVETLCVIDAAVHLGLTDASAVVDYADTSKGRPGAARLKSLGAEAAPAESVMETRLRWILLQAGLPRPEVQLDLRDGDGRFVGRADLCYPHARLVIEYDGVNHRDRLIEDNRRQNLLINAGFTLLRFTAPDLDRPESIVSQVRLALRRQPDV